MADLTNLTPAEVSQATSVPILELGRAWMSAPATAERAAQLGFTEPFGFWVSGRAGALGDVSGAVAASAIGFLAPTMVQRCWENRPSGLSAIDAANEFLNVAAAWGRGAFASVAESDLTRLIELAERVAEAALPSVGPLFTGWRDLDRPDDPAGRATVVLNVLREMRGGAHLQAIQAAGLSPHGALMSFVDDPIRGGVNGAERFGWVAPHPDPDVAARAEAERMTTVICEPAYSVLDEDEGREFMALIGEVRSCLD